MSHSTPLKLLFLSTPVGALGSGLGGGVELTLYNMAQAMLQQGHSVQVVAPAGSTLPGISLIQVLGALQITAQTQGRSTPITLPSNAVLANMWEYARKVQSEYDAIVNFAYDWLPFYLTPFFVRPIAHLVSMGSLSDAMDQVIAHTLSQFPGTIGMHSRAQAATFAFADRCRILGNGLDLSLYDFCPVPGAALAWVGRIAPEKGLEDAIEAVQKTNTCLKIWGAMPDESYWQSIQRSYPHASVEYRGFLPTAQLQAELGECRALLVTPHWIEAFGNVAIEALACGVPVIAYRRGGPAEIVQHGKTGWLVEPDSVPELVSAIGRIDEIDRHACRHQAEAEFSLHALGDRVEQWLRDILGC